MLQVYGYVAVPAGKVIKIIPNTDARQFPATDLPNSVSATSDEIVTQIITLKNISAAQLVPMLRPLIPQYGHLAAFPGGNMLIISDRASNVSRIVHIVERMDQSGDEPIEVIPLHNASAADVVRIVNSLNQGGQGADAGGAAVKIVADERTNSILLTGEKSQRLRLKALILNMDTPLTAGGDTQVRYLRYADAEKIADKLKGQATASAKAQGGPPAGAPPGGGIVQCRRQRHHLGRCRDQCAHHDGPAENHEVADGRDRQARHPPRAGPGRGRHRRSGREQEFQPRRAVAAVRIRQQHGARGHRQPSGGGTSIVDLAAAALSGGATAAATTGTTALSSSTVGVGATVAIGRVVNNGTSFAALVQALRSDGSSNIISTPSLITMNNEEAEVKVTQEIPLITGSYSNTTASVAGTTSPFQTIQREEVGTILKVTPHINEGNSVQLKIEQEDSSPGAKITDSADISTNKRSIKTTVLIEDGGIIVLGGLMSDTRVAERGTGCRCSAPFRCSAIYSSRAADPGRKRTCWCSSAPRYCAMRKRPRAPANRSTTRCARNRRRSIRTAISLCCRGSGNRSCRRFRRDRVRPPLPPSGANAQGATSDPSAAGRSTRHRPAAGGHAAALDSAMNAELQDPQAPRKLSFPFAKRHGVLLRGIADGVADTVCRPGVTAQSLAEVRRFVGVPLKLERGVRRILRFHAPARL